jgi:CheY-like chemotaxis protein
MGPPHPVLYAEDEEDDVFFLQRAFCEAGIANPLVVVSDGDAAMEYLSGTGRYENRAEYPFPCLVLLDLNLPARSGLDVLKWIRGQPAMCGLPVLVLTSSTQEADIQQAYLYGANAYLVKPGKPAELLGS